MSAAAPVLDLSLPQLALALLLVGLVIAVSVHQELGMATLRRSTSSAAICSEALRAL